MATTFAYSMNHVLHMIFLRIYRYTETNKGPHFCLKLPEKEVDSTHERMISFTFQSQRRPITISKPSLPPLTHPISRILWDVKIVSSVKMPRQS